MKSKSSAFPMKLFVLRFEWMHSWSTLWAALSASIQTRLLLLQYLCYWAAGSFSPSGLFRLSYVTSDFFSNIVITSQSTGNLELGVQAGRLFDEHSSVKSLTWSVEWDLQLAFNFPSISRRELTVKRTKLPNFMLQICNSRHEIFFSLERNFLMELLREFGFRGDQQKAQHQTSFHSYRRC